MRTSITVFDILIASPSDVPDERQAVRDAIQDWNIAHGRSQGYLLEPVMWETHASPTLGARPQEVINQQIVDECDALVGTFWTRLGSPTGKAPSGTVEEIDRMASEGKPVKLYFCNKPVPPDALDLDQLGALRAFRKDCQTRGLVDSYISPQELRGKLGLGLQRLVEHLSASTKIPQSASQTNADSSIESLQKLVKRWKILATRSDEKAAMQLMRDFTEWPLAHDDVIEKAPEKWETLVELAAGLSKWLFSLGDSTERFYQLGAAVLANAISLARHGTPLRPQSELALSVIQSVGKVKRMTDHRNIDEIATDVGCSPTDLTTTIADLVQQEMLTEQLYFGGKKSYGLTGAGLVSVALNPAQEDSGAL